MKNIVLKCNKCGRFYFGGKPETIGAIDKDCGGQMLDTGLFYEEASVIRKISSDNTFLDAMIDLKENNIIEFNLKMSQFKAQLSQGQTAKIQSDTRPRCPHCKSLNISKIGTGERIGSVAMLGVFSKKINKSFKCKSCGYTW